MPPKASVVRAKLSHMQEKVATPSRETSTACLRDKRWEQRIGMMFRFPGFGMAFALRQLLGKST
jgi:hypothetical protein